MKKYILPVLIAVTLLVIALLVSLEGQDCITVPQLPVDLTYNFNKTGDLDRDEIAGVTNSISRVLNYYSAKYLLAESEKQTKTERSLRLLGTSALLYILEEPLAGASHEYGHFFTHSVVGMNEPQLIDEDDVAKRDNMTPWKAFKYMFNNFVLNRNLSKFAGQSEKEWIRLDKKLIKNYVFPNFCEKHCAQYGEYNNLYSKCLEDCHQHRGKNIYFWKDYYDYSPAEEAGRQFWFLEKRIRIIHKAGGLNQNQYNAEWKVLNNEAHILDSIPYLLNASYTARYSPKTQKHGDLLILEVMREIGVKTTKKDVKITAQLPKLLSNSTLSFFLAGYNFIKTGEKKVEPIKFNLGKSWKMYWPEFASYITLEGPTIKSTGYVEWKKHRFGVSYEKSIAKNRNTDELGISWQGPIYKSLAAETKYIKNLEKNGNWFEGGISLNLEKISLGLNYCHAEGYSFHREIVGQTLSFLEDKESGLKGFLKINLEF